LAGVCIRAVDARKRDEMSDHRGLRIEVHGADADQRYLAWSDIGYR
jgi:hypothetical protein